jgi:hypothetical protein
MPEANGFYCCFCGSGPYLLESYDACTSCHKRHCNNCPGVIIPGNTSASATEVTQTLGYTSVPSRLCQSSVFGSSLGQEIHTHSYPLLYGRKSTTEVFAGPLNLSHIVKYCCECEEYGLEENVVQCWKCQHVYCGNCDDEEVK